MREYVQDYALIAKPLSDLLRKMIPFRFNGEQKLAFQMLKSKLTERSVSTIFRNDAETEVHTDACKYGLAAILLQRGDTDYQLHPVFYYIVRRPQKPSYELKKR